MTMRKTEVGCKKECEEREKLKKRTKEVENNNLGFGKVERKNLRLLIK